MPITSNELMVKVARQWVARREAQHLRPGTRKHEDLQLEFFVGAAAACSALDAPFNHDVLMLLAVGRDARILLPEGEWTPA